MSVDFLKLISIASINIWTVSLFNIVSKNKFAGNFSYFRFLFFEPVLFIYIAAGLFITACENALSPGLVQSQYASSEQEIADFNRHVQSSDGNIQEEIATILQQISVEVYEQKFTFRKDFVGGSKVENGTNVYGIVRASRGASTECIIINVPMYGDKYNYATGVALALARQMRSEIYWAKDVVYLFTDHSTYGTRAWLDAYHGMSSSHISASRLPARAGSIQAAVILELQYDSLRSINIKLEGYDGQLPNLDLSNLAVRLLKIERIPVSMNHQFHPLDEASFKAFENFLIGTVRMMKQLLTGVSSGNHGEFLLYNIEAVTLESKDNRRRSEIGFLSLQRVLEGVCRSLNNLLERFHQSFFFYLLPSTDRYISIGMYMPCLGLVLLVPVLKALSLIINVETTDEQQEKPAKEEKVTDDQPDDQSIDNILHQMGSKYAESTKEQEEKRSSWYVVISMMIFSHVMGFALFHSPYFTPVWSQMFSITPSMSYTMLLVSVHVLGIVLVELHSQEPMSLSSEIIQKLRTVSLLHSSILLGTVSIINFSFGFFTAVVVVPILAIIHGRQGWLRYVFKFLLVLISPTMLYACTHNMEELVAVYNYYETGQSLLYAFTTFACYPLWLQFWRITCWT